MRKENLKDFYFSLTQCNSEDRNSRCRDINSRGRDIKNVKTYFKGQRYTECSDHGIRSDFSDAILLGSGRYDDISY